MLKKNEEKLFLDSQIRLSVVEELLPSLQELQASVYILADGCTTSGVESVTEKLNQVSAEPLPKDIRAGLTLLSPAVYIYTSGTTGERPH